jgi:two-component system NarL family sensor kinase
MPEPGDFDSVIANHAYRGARLQLATRAALVCYLAATVLAVPPEHTGAQCLSVIAGYALWALAVAAWLQRGGRALLRNNWSLLLVDLIVIVTVTWIAGTGAERDWTSDALLYAMFAVPVMAATQLRPVVGLLIGLVATGAFLVSAAATRRANALPWPPLLLSALALAVVAAGCGGLSHVQRFRVMTIYGLYRDRAALLARLLSVEQREREVLAGQLHDGALQYLLAARLHLEDLRLAATKTHGEAFRSLEHGLTEAATLLRAKVAELHPAVLRARGLAVALTDLAATRGTVPRVAVDVTDWPARPTNADSLLFDAARELLANAVKHANARSVQIVLRYGVDTAHLSVRDDGHGLDCNGLAGALADGHIGLNSLRVRVEVAGGTLHLTSEVGNAPGPSGTTVTIEVPCVAASDGGLDAEGASRRSDPPLRDVRTT